MPLESDEYSYDESYMKIQDGMFWNFTDAIDGANFTWAINRMAKMLYYDDEPIPNMPEPLKQLLFYEPLSQVPLYINRYPLIVAWRMKIGK